MNPLFPTHKDDQEDQHKDAGYVLPRGRGKTLQPLQRAADPADEPKQENAAVNLIRQKLDALYADEPSAKQEIAEVETIAPRQRSKHQEFMYRLTTSGKSLAEIQTEWHRYYVNLSDAEKHQVWQEFYEANSRQPSPYTQFTQQHHAPRHPTHHEAKKADHENGQEAKPIVSQHMIPVPPKLPHQERRTTGEIKKQVLRKVRDQATKQTKAKQHLQSLLFGISSGVVVLVIVMFSFFNEVIIAPFIQPSRHVSATPIILDGNSVAPSETPEVIIPKINVQIPVVYDEKNIDEASVQRALERGVIHYPTTVKPGQKGNAAFFGHSSNNIFNKGQYKFAFVLLHELAPGDVFYLTHDKKVYSYKVFKKQVVAPHETWVLNTVPDKVATAALITCDPPGTTTNRLVVWGEQISPDPVTSTSEPTVQPVDAQPQELPSEGPSLWKRFTGWLF